MTRLRPARFPWTGPNVFFCSAIVAGTYLVLKFWSPLGKLASAAAALVSTGFLAAAFIVPPGIVLLVGALRSRRREDAPGDLSEAPPEPAAEGSAGRVPEPSAQAISFDPRELWLTRGGLARDVIAGVVLGLLLAFMNGVSIQRGIADYSPRGAGALSALVWCSSSLPDVSMLLVALGVIAPVAEEVFFRGVLYAGLRKQVPVVPAVILSSAAFAAAHMDSTRLLAFVLGVVAAMLIEFTGSIIPAILAHMGVNIGFVLFLANRGRLAETVPPWAVWTACVVMNVLFFVLGQPLFGKTNAPDAADVAPADAADSTASPAP